MVSGLDADYLKKMEKGGKKKTPPTGFEPVLPP